jgi:hypothetical protein
LPIENANEPYLIDVGLVLELGFAYAACGIEAMVVHPADVAQDCAFKKLDTDTKITIRSNNLFILKTFGLIPFSYVGVG